VAGKHRILFAPQVASRWIWYLGQALRGDLVASGLSFFADSKNYKLGETPVSSSEFILVDDPQYKKSVGLALWDSEGYPTQRNEFISGGILKIFPHNYQSSLALKQARTGNAVRGWGQLEPIVGSHNLCMEPGKRDFVDLLRNLGSGLLVEGIDSIESIHLPTGEFTVGCVGHRVENGVEGEPVGRFVIKGKLQDLFRNVGGVGRDIRWYGRVASGSLLCDDVLVVQG
jgi:PmbA protein